MIIIAPYKVNIELMSNEIEKIIDELERTEFNVYTFLNYDKIIEKLKASLSTKNEQNRAEVSSAQKNKDFTRDLNRADVHSQNKELMDKDYSKEDGGVK